MKRTLFILVASLTAFTCTDKLQEKAPSEDGPLVPLKFTATGESPTKTSLGEDFSILWNADDRITVFAGENADGREFAVESVSEDGRSAVFSGLSAVSPVYYALSPAQGDAAIGGGVISAVLPARQSAVEGSFAAEANVSVAKSTDGNLKFRNIGSVVGFKVGNDGITAVRLSGAESLAGRADIEWNGGAQKATVTEAENFVELAGTFEKGKTYYFVAYPSSFTSGTVLTFYREGEKAEMVNSKPLSLKRNGNVFLGEITVPESKWGSDFEIGDALFIEGEGADEAGQQVAFSTDFYNTSVGHYGDQTEELSKPSGYEYEIYTQLSEGKKFYFRTEHGGLYGLTADGTGVERISSADAVAYQGTSRGGVFRIRLNMTAGTAAIRRAESARYLQPAAKVNTQMTYEGHGVWKIENYAFGWLMKENWGNDERWKFKFQIYYNETGTWQNYGLHTDARIQPITQDWDWGNYLTVKNVPELSIYQTEGEYTATVRLHLNAEDGYTYSFDDITPTGGWTSMSVISSEEMFPMHKTVNGNSLFEGVSTFTEGQTVEMTATDVSGRSWDLTTTATVSGPAYFVADPATRTYAFTALPELLAEGNAVNGFSASAGATLSYAGAGIYRGENLVFTGSSEGNPDALTPTYPYSRNGRARFTFVKPSNGYAPMFQRLNGSRNVLENTSYGATSEMQINPGTYNITVNLRDFTFEVLPAQDGSRRISVMGSSVPTGTGAADDKGYIYLYGTQAITPGWLISNISIPGDTTTKLLDRYDDLTADGGDYVVFALSLGNEGIHGAADQQAVYNQWKTNMRTLISKARSDGKTVVVTGNYGRGDFVASDYAFVKAMNLEIHQWDLPSANVLGAVDDGEGHWASGYQNGSDAYHPNTGGHYEMSCTLVPSLFDALAAGKALPERNSSGGMATTLAFTPEATVHPFTVSFYIRTTSDGTVLQGEGLSAPIRIAGGKLAFGSLTGAGTVADGQWHLVTLTHYYARGVTDLYLDGSLQGSVSGRMAVKGFRVGGASASVRELFFWRSAMNADEIAAVVSGAMLKSSLEIYAPLAGNLSNLAQSTNTLSEVPSDAPDIPEVQYVNPLFTDFSLPDPDVIRGDDGMFYLYATEHSRSSADMRNVPIMRSSDLLHWQRIGAMFTDENHPQITGGVRGIWAPAVHRIGDTYVCYYSQPGDNYKHAIGVATSPTPYGPFTDHGKLIDSDEQGVDISIDAYLYQEDGRNYLFWGSFRDIHYLELTSDGLAIKDKATQQKVKVAGGQYEATVVEKRNGWYYLICSTGNYAKGQSPENGYKIVVGRSRNLSGPYVDRQGRDMLYVNHELILKGNQTFTSPGHCSKIITDDAGTDWILYHAYIAPLDYRVLMIDRLDWVDGWPVVSGCVPTEGAAQKPYFNGN